MEKKYQHILIIIKLTSPGSNADLHLSKHRSAQVNVVQTATEEKG